MGPVLKFGGKSYPLVVDLKVQETLDLEDEFGVDAAKWTTTREGIARIWATLRRNGVNYTVADIMRAEDDNEFGYDFAGSSAEDPQRAEEAPGSDAEATTPGTES